MFLVPGPKRLFAGSALQPNIVDAQQWALLDTEYVRKHIVLLANSC